MDVIKRFLVDLPHLETFYNGGRHVRSRLGSFQEFGHRAGEPARSRTLKDWFESIQGAVQVE